MKSSKTVIIFVAIAAVAASLTNSKEQSILGPSKMVCSKIDKLLYVAEQDANQLDVIDAGTKKKVKSISLEDSPSEIFINSNDKIIILQGIKEGKLSIYDRQKLKKKKEILVGHSPVAIEETETHYIICNRFPGEITFINKKELTIENKIKVGREPIAMDYLPNKNLLLVAHHLPEMASTAETVASKITVVNTKRQEVEKTILLPNGSSGVKDIEISKDGKHAFITHILARYHLPTTQLERGWMNTNALSILDVDKIELWKTILLDDVDHGAANPYDVQCSEDGKQVFVSHAGTHEISAIDWEKVKENLYKDNESSSEYGYSENLGFVYPYRQRIKIDGNAPRNILVIGNELVAANYFSDDLCFIDLETGHQEKLSLGSAQLSSKRRGEMYFNDASYCFQNWQSCASCHPDARVDGFNWDLLNDGIGNPKNAKSMLLSHKTPPVMSLGVRAHAKVAVRAGFKYIQFVEVPEEYMADVDVYLESLEPVSSPYGSTNVEKGKALFEELKCNYCHPFPYYTNMQSYSFNSDKSKKWDTPTLVELWRTAPYWHDGRYATLKELFEEEKHGLHNSGLSLEDLQALERFLLTL